MVTSKDAKQIVGGAGLALLGHVALETPRYLAPELIQDNPLYSQPVEWLPPVEDLIASGVPMAAYLLTKTKAIKTSEKTKNMALGGALYGAGMLFMGLFEGGMRMLRQQEWWPPLHAETQIVGGMPTGSKDGNRVTPSIQEEDRCPCKALLV